MTRLRITTGAFKKLYAARQCVIVDGLVAPMLWQTLTEMVSGLTVFVVTTDYVLCLPDEVDKKRLETQPLLHSPVSIVGICVSERNDWLADSVIEYLEYSTQSYVPYITRLPKVNALAIANFVASLYQKITEERELITARSERQLALLRVENENMRLKFEKARRVLTGFGYTTDLLEAIVEPGSDKISPNNGLPENTFKQLLPHAAIGLDRVDLYVDLPVDRMTVGKFLLKVLSSVSQTIISYAEIHFDELCDGWNTIHLVPIADAELGDAELIVDWCSESEGAYPALRLADSIANRFGNTVTGKTLAMRLFRKLIDPVKSSMETDSALAISSIIEKSFDDLGVKPTVTVYLGNIDDAMADIGASPLSFGSGYMQTHPVPGKTVQVAFESLVTANIRSISIDVETEHPRGPECVYSVFIAPSGHSSRTLELVERIRNGELQGVDDGINWTSVTVGGDQQARLTVDLPASTVPKDLIVCVYPTSDTVAFGWCRWKRLQLSASGQDELLALSYPDEVIWQQPEASSDTVYSVKLSELQRDMVPLHGWSTNEKYNDELGFTPVYLNNELGYLQTHTLADIPSAALFPLTAFQGVKAISTVVSTRHEGAPDQEYFIAIVKDTSLTSDDMLRRLKSLANLAKGSSSDGSDVSEIVWMSQSVPALEKVTLTLKLDEPLTDTGHVIFGVMPTDNIAFGWCRWYDLHMRLSVV